jgi:hypothetical protein
VNDREQAWLDKVYKAKLMRVFSPSMVFAPEPTGTHDYKLTTIAVSGLDVCDLGVEDYIDGAGEGKPVEGKPLTGQYVYLLVSPEPLQGEEGWSHPMQTDLHCCPQPK